MGYSRRTSNYPERITLFGPTHIMSMTNLIAIDVETLKIDSVCYLKKEFIEWIHMNPWLVIIPNCQSGWFMSWLCMWSFDLRHQRHLVDRWSCFDYTLQIPSHGISKTSYIRYDMNSAKMIMWSRWDHPPSIFEEWDVIKLLAKIVEILEKEYPMISYTYQY